MEKRSEHIAVIGLGKLGIPIAACVASKGYDVVGVDKDAKKIEAINRGVSPIFEAGLQEKIEAARSHLTATEDYARAVLNSDITIIVVPTPSEPTGGFSLKYVFEAVEQIGTALQKKKDFHVVVLTSTVMPGSTDSSVVPRLEKLSGKKCGRDFGVIYSPEFIALGTVIRDFLKPDFLLIGESDPKTGEIIERFYKTIYENDPPVARMNFVSAELAKLAVNTYVTNKITFANVLARICERVPEADVDRVTHALGLDSRIGNKYLKGSIGYGGPCFPRDNRALSVFSRSVGVPPSLAEATDSFNRQQIVWLKQVAKGYMADTKTSRVGILGLSYKPSSDFVEESQGLMLAQAFCAEGINVVVYDPAAMGNAGWVLDCPHVTFARSARECIQSSDVVIITTPWEEFKKISAEEMSRQGESRVLIDCWRLLPALNGQSGITYVPLGLGVPEMLGAVHKFTNGA